MTAVLAALAGLLLVGGGWAVLVGVRGRPAAPPVQRARTSPAARWAAMTRRPPGERGRQRDLLLAAGVVVGLVLAALSGWVVAVVLVPAAALVLPAVLSPPPSRDVALLEALDRWVRSLAATLPTGRSIPDAIRLSRRGAPELLAAPLAELVARLNGRWPPREALRRFADALDSPDADAVVAALIMASERGSNGAAATLAELADSQQSQLRGRREIETERAKPYVVVRQVTAITAVTLGAMLLLARSFFAPYGTPVGQVIIAVLLSAYLGSLLLMRRRAHPPRRSRLLIDRSGSSGSELNGVASARTRVAP